MEATNKNIKEHLGEVDRHIQGLARVLAICFVHISYLCSHFHRCDPVIISVWHGGHPPCIGRDPVP